MTEMYYMKKNNKMIKIHSFMKCRNRDGFFLLKYVDWKKQSLSKMLNSLASKVAKVCKGNFERRRNEGRGK